MSFDQRRLSDPQGVIDDLLRLMALQANDIHEKNKKLALAEHDGITEIGQGTLDGSIKPKSGKGAPRAKKPKKEEIPEDE